MVTRKVCGRKRLWPNLRYSPGIYVEDLWKTTKTLCHDSRAPGRELKTWFPEYEAGELTIWPRRLSESCKLMRFGISCVDSLWISNRDLEYYCKKRISISVDVFASSIYLYSGWTSTFGRQCETKLSLWMRPTLWNHIKKWGYDPRCLDLFTRCKCSQPHTRHHSLSERAPFGYWIGTSWLCNKSWHGRRK